MLRYYDETGLLKPAQIDRFTGYRMYSVEQIPILHKIVFLRDTGFNVSEIAVALNHWNNEYINNQLLNKKLELQEAIKLVQDKLAKINIAIDDIQNEKISTYYNFSLKSIPSYQVLSLRKIIPDYFCEGILWKELSVYIEQNNLAIPVNNYSFAIYHDMEYKDTDVDVEVCVVVNEPRESTGGFAFRETERVDNMACAMVYGPFENIAVVYASFAHWLLHHNQFKMCGQNRQICHRGPWNEKDPDKYLTEIQIPVTK